MAVLQRRFASSLGIYAFELVEKVNPVMSIRVFYLVVADSNRMAGPRYGSMSAPACIREYFPLHRSNLTLQSLFSSC